MEKNRRYVFGMLILLLFAAAFAWMIHVGFPGTGGTVVAMAILTFAIVVPFVERASAIPRHFIAGHISLLADILLLAGAAYLIVAEPGRLSMTFYLVAAGGLVSLIYWIADKRYKGRSMKTFIAEELHIIPCEVEIGVVIFTLIVLIVRREFPSVVMSISMIVFSIDAVSQILLKRRSRIK